MKPPKFNFHYSKNVNFNGNPQFQQFNVHHRYHPSKFIPLALIMSLWVSPSIQQRTTSWIDRHIITTRGLNARDDFYYRNNIYKYGLETIPRASFTRRLGSWMIDGAIVSMFIVPIIKFWRFPKVIGTTIASVAWFGRDIWLQRYGMQSPGRYWCGIHVISTNGLQYETWNTMKLNSIVAILLGASDFIKSSMYSNAAYLSVVSRGSKQQREAWVVLFGFMHIVLGIGTALGYGLAFGQLVTTKQTWFDKVAQVQVVNVGDLPLDMPLGYNYKRVHDITRSRSNINENDEDR
eukprot:300616_1